MIALVIIATLCLFGMSLDMWLTDRRLWRGIRESERQRKEERRVKAEIWRKIMKSGKVLK